MGLVRLVLNVSNVKRLDFNNVAKLWNLNNVAKLWKKQVKSNVSCSE